MPIIAPSPSRGLTATPVAANMAIAGSPFPAIG